MSTVLYSHSRFSNSGKHLARGLGIRRIKHTGSRFVGAPRHTLINWGSHGLPEALRTCTIKNPTDRVARASDKLQFFQRLAERNLSHLAPHWTTDPTVAGGWRDDDGKVVVRALLRGSAADGLTISRGDEPIPQAPLYTRYYNRSEEYRVHVAFGQVIDIQRKARSRGVADEDVNWEVRNLANGFIYARNEGHTPSQTVMDVVRQTHEAMQLDFGAYDVLWKARSDQAVVLEVNTAPGLVGTTLDIYTQAFRTGLRL